MDDFSWKVHYIFIVTRIKETCTLKVSVDVKWKLFQSLKSHTVAVVSLNWEEDGQLIRDDFNEISTYENCTSHFFPPAPRVPWMPGLVSGDTGFMDDSEDSFQKLSECSYQRFNIMCSGDNDGNIFFSIVGIFPIGKIVSYSSILELAFYIILINRVDN
ncbi:hypothetical protein SLEP1_g39688 [Rubroshorea leprosula]|uniref:Uncharacterized protein n=1 Tax=Rubroshorea leprosula TaxID=152421 RepID=A0AAV5L176_9ROSI|nr:hypothetical protein SLEP1_g39688 [Rubroshorea leprosula]